MRLHTHCPPTPQQAVAKYRDHFSKRGFPYWWVMVVLMMVMLLMVMAVIVMAPVAREGVHPS